MLLKKQTVWLLTMLSLVVVLSVYYITSPETSNEFATGEESKAKEEAQNNSAASKTDTNEQSASDTKTDGSTVSTVGSDEEFDEKRLELEDQRSAKEEELTDVMGSTEATAEQKSEAAEKIDQLREVADQEKMLETLIKADNYDDVLVRSVDGVVNVTVKADKLSAEAANDIIQLVRKNMNEPGAYVAVKFDPSK
ncbi:SpoIIIAH-like family protein [Niallia nealsonii]|uniref:Stage III sporulation protein AH n=1 Tax=Niallia nealsonii TaxID=115979 RepID=A0A2N0Z862_9BACI|nr:SpoIIIAH-like family protein [Niallia nealsonii]PKG25683.1 stage III sporulation protein AH [Niallia nealsonii]